jgi:Flp pilus assembly protein TadD
MTIARSTGAHAVVLCLLLGASPAYAGLFDSSPLQPPTVSDGTIAQIQQAFDDERYLDAGKLLDQALLISGNDPRLIYWVGELSLARGRYEDALANFKIAAADSKVGSLAAEGEGIALAQLGRTDEAIAALQTAVARSPTAWKAWNALGTEFDRRHDWADADTAYSHAITNSGGAAIALNNRGFSRLSQSRLDEAILDFVAALQKKPDLTAARNNLRLAMAMKGEYDRAVTGAAATDRAAVLNNAGYAAMLRGDYSKAKDLLTEAMKAKGEYYALAAANLEMTQSLAKEQSRDKGHADSR